MVFEVKDVDLAGRIGKLCTKSGCIETPAFFPVIDVERQEVSIEDIRRAGFNQVITNAYLTWKRYGSIAERKGIHGILGFDGVVMTDSGAYQILEYGDIEVDQKTIIEFQSRIGSDIGVILDIPTGDVDRERALRTVEETLHRAREAIPLIREAKDTLWVLPIQGGKHLDLVEYSAREASKIADNYHVLGIGSPTVFLEKYDYRTIAQMIITAKSNLPWGKPVHLFGAGHPLIITIAVALGVDMFDSASYILYARDDRYITEYGVERLERLDYFPCNCPVCSRYTPEDLRRMNKKERTRLLAIHNLYAISRALRRVKQAIREGRLWELLEEASRMHPSAFEALDVIQSNNQMLEKSTPTSKGVVRGIRLYDRHSLRRPIIERYRERLLRYLRGRPGTRREALLIPYPEDPSACPIDPAYPDSILAYYAPFLALIPREICGIYPTIHFHYPSRAVDPEVIDDAAGFIDRALSEAGVEKVRVLYVRGHWSEAIAAKLQEIRDNVELAELRS